MKEDNTHGIRVFVYGSLKQGRGNHDMLSKGRLLGRCMIEGKYSMLDLGYYPGLVHRNGDAPTRKVLGEVYLVDRDTLQILDMLEGHPNYYARHKVQTPWKGAWCYFLPMAYYDHKLPATMIEETYVWRPNEEEQEYVRNADRSL